jgi:hypothetical protein
MFWVLGLKIWAAHGKERGEGSRWRAQGYVKELDGEALHTEKAPRQVHTGSEGASSVASPGVGEGSPEANFSRNVFINWF